MGIRVLGPVEVDGGEALRPRDRQLLAVLAVRRGVVVSTDEIAEAVWQGRPPASWAKQVQICVARLRRVLGPAAIETVPGAGYRLVEGRVVLDVPALEEALSAGRALAASGQPDRAVAAMTAALALVRGPPYSSLEDWPPARVEARRIGELVRDAEDDLVLARLAAGDHRQVVGTAERLVAQEPLREGRWGALATAQYRCGRQAEALRTLRRCRGLLRDQLGVDPGEDLLTLEEQILRHDPDLRPVPQQRSVSPGCPYKGLAPLSVGERLFGRESEVATCLARVVEVGFLVVTGPSGSGKSSLVRAGLVPALEARGLRCEVVLPGPGGELLLPHGSGPPPVVVVDQLEQVFTSERGADWVRTTCAALAAYARRAPVVVTVRADHLSGVAADPSLGVLAESSLHLLAPLTGDRLREAIVRPAEEAGLRLEAGLVDLVVRDTEGEPGGLPLMSHTLVETWRRREGNVLTVAAYGASGGITGAVARTADRLYEELGPADRDVLRSVLLRLVTPALDGAPVRCRVPLRALQEDPAHERIATQLVAERLLTAADGVVEISHEALVRAWPRLRAWLDEDAGSLRALRHLTTAADGWEGLGRPDSELYRGARLEATQELTAGRHAYLTMLEQEFLQESQRLAANEREVLRVQTRLEARRNRRLRGLLAVVACLLLVAIAAGSLAARTARRAAVASEEAALASIVSQSLALRATDRDAAALLAVEAHRRWPGEPRALSALLGTFTGSPGFLGNRYLDRASTLGGAVVPGTGTAVVARDGTRLSVIDLESGDELRTMSPISGKRPMHGAGVAVSADGRRAAVLLALPAASCRRATLGEDGACGAFAVYDVRTGRALTGPVATPDGPGGVALSADSSLVAVLGSGTGMVTVHDAASGRRVSRTPGLASPSARSLGPVAGAVAFAADGLVYAGSHGGPIRGIRPRTGVETRRLVAPPGHSEQHLLPGSDGIVVTGGRSGLAAFELDSGRRLWTAALTGSTPDPCPWLTASEVPGRVYCGSHYGEIEERDRRTGLRTGRSLDTQLGSVGRLDVTTGGAELVAFGAERPAITRWRLDGSGPVSHRVAQGYVAADRYGYTDETLVVARRSPLATRDVDLRDYALWDPESDRMVDDLAVDVRPGIEGIGWAGRDLLVGMDVAAARLRWYDAGTRSLVPGPEIGPECDHLWPSADGKLAYCGGDGRVWVIDVAGRRLREPEYRVEGWVTSVSATRSGERVVISSATAQGSQTVVLEGASGDVLAGPVSGPQITGVSLDGDLFGTTGGAITRYDLDTLEPHGELAGAHGEVNTLQFSDDGRMLLATSVDQSAALYDVASGTRLGDPISTSAPLIYPAFLRPDGGALAVTDADGVVIWDLDPERLAEAACAVAGRNLTPAEWRSYVGHLGDHRATCPELG